MYELPALLYAADVACGVLEKVTTFPASFVLTMLELSKFSAKVDEVGPSICVWVSCLVCTKVAIVF